jgi:hypothetical protein
MLISPSVQSVIITVICPPASVRKSVMPSSTAISGM